MESFYKQLLIVMVGILTVLIMVLVYRYTYEKMRNPDDNSNEKKGQNNPDGNSPENTTQKKPKIKLRNPQIEGGAVESDETAPTDGVLPDNQKTQRRNSDNDNKEINTDEERENE